MFLTFLFGFCAGAASIILLVVLAIWYWMGLGPKDHPSISPVFVKVKHPKVCCLSNSQYTSVY